VKWGFDCFNRHLQPSISGIRWEISRKNSWNRLSGKRCRTHLPRNSPVEIIEVFKIGIPLLLEESVYLVWNTFLNAEVRSGPPISVRTHPEAINTIARDDPEFRAAKLRMNWFKAALLPR
jgi:hypothetical protein